MRGSRKKYQSTVGVVNVWGGKIKVAGEIVPYAGSSIPSGFLLANGALVSRASYANLFAAIGVVYGAGDGSTTFAIPDLRGEFIRGTDNGRGVDSARVNGSPQVDLTKSHSHATVAVSYTANIPAFTQSVGGYVGVVGAGAGAESGNASAATGGLETRPRNIAMQYLIQY